MTIAYLKDLKKMSDDELEKKMEELSAVAQKIGAAMYQSAQGGQGAQPGAEGGNAQPGEDKKDQGPIEGEFTEKK